MFMHHAQRFEGMVTSSQRPSQGFVKYFSRESDILTPEYDAVLGRLGPDACVGFELRQHTKWAKVLNICTDRDVCSGIGGMCVCGQRFEGITASWKSPCGWIKCLRIGGAIFCHKQNAVTGCIDSESSVVFELGTDQKSGKLWALNNVLIDGGFGKPSSSGANLRGCHRRAGCISFIAEPINCGSKPQELQHSFGAVVHWNIQCGHLKWMQLQRGVLACEQDVVTHDVCGTFELRSKQRTGKSYAGKIEVYKWVVPSFLPTPVCCGRKVGSLALDYNGLDVVPGYTFVFSMPVAFTLGANWKRCQMVNSVKIDVSSGCASCMACVGLGSKTFGRECANAINSVGFSWNSREFRIFSAKGILMSGIWRVRSLFGKGNGLELVLHVTLMMLRSFLSLWIAMNVFHRKECVWRSQLVVRPRVDSACCGLKRARACSRSGTPRPESVLWK